MSETMIGLRIRQRRQAAGLRQSELARRMGISASYLNLIERDRRRASPAIVARAAAALDLGPDALDGALERRLADRLIDLAAEPEFADLALDAEGARDLLGRRPDWARALLRVWSARTESLRAVEALSDRLTHDPGLAATLHAMLDRIAAIRSASEILASIEDIEPAQRARFHTLLEDESARLSEIAAALAAFFERAPESAVAASPAEEVEEALLDVRARFPGLEPPAAEAAAHSAALPTHGAPPPAAAGPAAAAADARPPWQRIDDALAAAEARAGLAPPPAADPLAHRLARAEALAAVEADAAITAEIATRPRLAAPAAGRRARAALLAAAADARLAPEALLIAEGEAAAWDLDALAARFALPPTRLARRLTALPPPAPRAAYLRVDAAGQALERRLLPGLPLPRLGAACPLWSVYRAFAEPGRTLRQFAALPRGEPWIFVARADPVGPAAWNRPAPLEALLLALPAAEAARTVYAPAPRETPEPVGPACRVCPRPDCAHRAEDPILG